MTLFNDKFADNILNGLGDVTEHSVKADTVNELLDSFKLNWTVSKQGLLLPDGSNSGFYGAVRTDKNLCFATCGDSYEVFQNSELAELVLRIAERTGYGMENGGSFNGGRKVFLQLRTNSLNGIGENKDILKGFATAINSHDGSTSLRFGHSNITISCQNTFHRAAKSLQHKARHTENMREKIDEALRQVEGVMKIEETIFARFLDWASIPTTREMLVKVVQQVTEVDITKPKAKDVSGYKYNRASELTSAISSEMKQKGQTLWGLFSGVTKYTTHTMPAPNRELGRTESKMVGSGLDIDNKTFDMVEKFATAHMVN